MQMLSKALSSEERIMIHEKAIKILEEVGIKFPSEMALETLAAGGAEIDYDNQVAYISRSMVEAALKSVPKTAFFGARNPEHDFTLPNAVTGYNLDGCGVYAHDYKTGKRRDATLKDVANSSRVFEELDLGLFVWPPISPCDVPHGPRSIVSSATCYMNTSKHVQDEVKTREEVPFIIEIAKAIAGNDAEVKRRKLYSVTYCTVAPLTHDRDMLEATMDLSRYDAPILMYPMPACGTTGPASLYSNIAVATAENLSSLVLFQRYSPAVSLVFGAALGIVNNRSGMFLEGAPETILQMCALRDMAEYYNMPNIMAGCLSDAKEPGMQSVIEKMVTTLPLVMSNADVIQGMGLVESSMTLSLEQLVIDNEIAHLCKRLKEGIEISPEKDFYEDIKQVGHGGHFLKQKNTRKAFRSDEFYQSELLDRGSYDEWVALGSPSILQNANKKVEEILKAEMKHPLDPNIAKVIKEIVEEATAKLV